MRHSEARVIYRDAFRRIYGREPSEDELDAAQAVAILETKYGRWEGQFARLAAQGHFNHGAEQRGQPPCPEGRMPGSDVGTVCFYVWPSDDAAAENLLKILKKTGIPLDQGPEAQSAAMRRSGYYGGRNWSRENDYNLAYYRAHPDKAVEWGSQAEADSANVREYAAAIRQRLKEARTTDDPTPGGPPPVRDVSVVEPSIGPGPGPSGVDLSRPLGALVGLAALGGVGWALGTRTSQGREAVQRLASLARAWRR